MNSSISSLSNLFVASRRKLRLRNKRIKFSPDLRDKLKSHVEAGLIPKPLLYDSFMFFQPPWATLSEIQEKSSIKNFVPLRERLRFQYFFNLQDRAPKEHSSFSPWGDRPSDRFVDLQIQFMRRESLSEIEAAEKAYKKFVAERRSVESTLAVAKQQAIMLDLMPYRSTSEGGFYQDNDIVPKLAKVSPIDPINSKLDIGRT